MRAAWEGGEKAVATVRGGSSSKSVGGVACPCGERDVISCAVDPQARSSARQHSLTLANPFSPTHAIIQGDRNALDLSKKYYDAECVVLLEAAM